MFLRNRWYVAAWDYEVDRRPLARTICNEPVLLYRKLDGSIVALRDACPHRLLPLSMGFKEGDSLRCRYHGLLVGPSGEVAQMPSKTDRVPPHLCVKPYICVQRHRLVWIWIGEPRAANEALIPDFRPRWSGNWVLDGGYYTVACDYRLLIDNLMDLSHETHVHKDTIGQPEILEALILTESEGEQVTVKRWMSAIDAPPFWRDALKQDGLVDRWQICRYLAPSSILIDVGVAPVESRLTIDDRDGGVRGMVINALTPESETRTHYFWGMARSFDLDDAGFTQRFKAQQSKVFAEDVEILEAQQRSIGINGDMKLRSFSIDAGGSRCRALLERLMREAGSEAVR